MKTFLLISSATLLMAGEALAQDAGATAAQAPAANANANAQAAAPAAAASKVTVTDDELKRFAAIAIQTRDIMANHQPKIAAATDAAAKSKAEAAMSGELQVAVTDRGFTIQRYNEIATAMQTDQALVARMQQVAAGGPAASAPANP